MTMMFDARAALARIRAERAAAAAQAPEPISRVSSFSRGAGLDGPPAVDFWLTGIACELDNETRNGGRAVFCPAGGLDVTRADGRLWLLSPSTVARLRAARLLPDHLLDLDVKGRNR